MTQEQELLLIAARNYAASFPDERNTAYNSFIKGALWQREQEIRCVKIAPPQPENVQFANQSAGQPENK